VRHGSIIESPKRDVQTTTECPHHVLVVDDDPMVCMAIEIYLQRNNFRVTIAGGGDAGLRALENEQFDLMVVDIFMPHMRGFESIRLFHDRAPAIPLIAMSGYAFADLNSPSPDFLRMGSSSAPRAACASRSRRMRCWPPSRTVLPSIRPLPRGWVSALLFATRVR